MNVASTLLIEGMFEVLVGYMCIVIGTCNQFYTSLNYYWYLFVGD